MSSRQHVEGRLPEIGESPVPLSGLIVSVLALVIAAGANLMFRETLQQYSALVWILALVPPFLLAYYRGWEGAALALAAGMILLIAVEVGGPLLTERDVQWWNVGGVIVLLIAVSLGAGAIAAKLRTKASDALQLAYSDSLTGLPNRRILDMFLSKEFAAARRGGQLTIVVFDIDGFKRFNDSHGHAAGDDALRAMADLLDQNTRAMNLSGRFGGDEFLSLLPGEAATGSHAFADRVRQCVSEAPVASDVSLTVSVGIAEFDSSMEEVVQLMEAADRALYAAKRAGGDRVVVNAESGWIGERPGMLVLDAGGRVVESSRHVPDSRSAGAP